jgi:pimeloyl-ACP methyl ester carboxylesterase
VTNRVALLLHGGPGGTKEGPSDLYVHLADALAAIGVASARFDFPGEGESGGDYTATSPSQQVAQSEAINRWMRSGDFDHIAVVGESFGATAALGSFQTLDAEALVLLWPAIWLLDGTFAPLIPEDWQGQLQQSGVIDIDGKKVGRAFIEELFAHSDREHELQNVNVPTLLIHGDADREVPVAQSRRAHDLLRDPKRLIVVPEADHCL